MPDSQGTSNSNTIPSTPNPQISQGLSQLHSQLGLTPQLVLGSASQIQPNLQTISIISPTMIPGFQTVDGNTIQRSLTPIPSTQAEPKGRRASKRKSQPSSPKKSSPGKSKNVNWRSKFNKKGRSALGVIVDWLTTPEGKGFRVDQWRGDGGKTSKVKVSEEVAKYLHDNEFPNIPAKLVEQQIRLLETNFRNAKDFRKGTGQGVLKKSMDEARKEKERNGYDSDSEEWKELVESVNESFEDKIRKMCPFYDEIVTAFSTRKANTPDAIQDSNGPYDEALILPDSRQSGDIEDAESDVGDKTGGNGCSVGVEEEDEGSIDLAIAGSMDLAITGIESPIIQSQEVNDLPPPASKKARKARAVSSGSHDQRRGSASLVSNSGKPRNSADSVTQLVVGHLPSRDERKAKNQQEDVKWSVQRSYLETQCKTMEAEQSNRRLEVENSNRLVEVLSHGFSAYQESSTSADQSSSNAQSKELNDLKIRREEMELKKLENELEGQRYDAATRRARLYKEYMDMFGVSLSEAKKIASEELGE